MSNQTTSPPTTSTTALAHDPRQRATADARYDSAQVPLSVRHPWHRAAMLGVLVTLMVLPWTTSTGCGGDESPVTETGFELFARTLSDEPLYALAPLALFAATLLGVAARLVVRAGRRAWLSFAMLVLVAGGAFFTWVSTVLPNAAEHVEHHFASMAGTFALVAMIFDALVRLILGVREWWIARRGEYGATKRCARRTLRAGQAPPLQR